MDNISDRWLEMMYWDISGTYDEFKCFDLNHEEMLEKYGDIYIEAIRINYWTSKLGKCFTGGIRNPSDDDIAEYFQISKEQLMDIIDSEDIDKLIEDNERAFLEEQISEEVQKV